MAPNLDYYSSLRQEVRKLESISKSILAYIYSEESSFIGTTTALDEVKLNEEDKEFIAVVIEAIQRNEILSIDDLHEAIHKVEERVQYIKSVLFSHYGPRIKSVEGSIAPYIEAIKKTSNSPIKVADAVLEIIDSIPGLPIVNIHAQLSQRSAIAHSYSTTHKAVVRLEEQEEIVTMGGPQGRYRYCFPDPGRLAQWDQFYGGPFLLRGKIQADFSDQFGTLTGHFKSVHCLNSRVSPTLIVTRFGDFRPPGGKEIKCIGRLHSFSQQELNHIGIAQTEGELSAKGLVEAARITVSEGRKDVEVYSDRQMIQSLSLFTPPE